MTAPNLDVFKDIISSDELDVQINAVLSTWMDTYLAELDRQRGFATPVPGIRSYVTLQDFRHDPENQTPAVVVVNAGTSGRPIKSGEGWYRSAFLVAVAVITSTKDQQSTRRMSQIYGAAVRAIMLQKKAGGNMVSDVEWLGEANDQIDRDSGDQLAACTNSFELMVDGIVKERGAGPAAPSTATPVPVPAVVAGLNSVTVTEKED
jgi:hypothetical protein